MFHANGQMGCLAAIHIERSGDVRGRLQQAVQIAEVVVAGVGAGNHLEFIQGQGVIGARAVQGRRDLIAVLAVFARKLQFS